MEIQKVQEAYESLVKSSQKRERLENALKVKLEEEVKKLKAQNEELRGKHYLT
jgi:ribosome-binding protein aMBF1 (putative translation factor)